MTTTTTTTPKSIKGTQTEKNLVVAYLAESTAYTRYVFYSKAATKESYYPIAKAFQDTADNEMHHAKIFFGFLEGGSVSVELPVDAGVIGTTEENLKIAANEEQEEGVDLYRKFAQVAREEGFDVIADHFEAIATIEQRHEKRFLAYLKQVQDGTVWKRDHAIVWQCLVCGYQYTGTEPPTKCPACDHPYQHYMAMDMDND